jgi:peptidoglycan/xylan/chitin deacetylase (PgdA/CDA1 family)
MHNTDNAVYLTFDDGPDPASTPELLKFLNTYNIKATFFCLGKKVEKHPELLQAILKNGHGVGIHGYDHLSGWKTRASAYTKNINCASALIPSKLFRPPYGRMTCKQYSSLKKNYKIVMWSLMPGDFKKDSGRLESISSIIKKIKPGDIIVLHDSVKTITYCTDFILAMKTKPSLSKISFGVID